MFSKKKEDTLTKQCKHNSKQHNTLNTIQKHVVFNIKTCLNTHTLFY